MKWMIVKTILLCALIGCSEDNVARINGQTITFGEEFSIAINENVIVTSNESGEITDSLRVRLDSMLDSTCPGGDINCLVAGKATLNITVSSGKETEKVDMCIGGDCALDSSEFERAVDTVNVKLNSESYSLIFSDLLPHDRKIEQPERAVLSVIK